MKTVGEEGKEEDRGGEEGRGRESGGEDEEEKLGDWSGVESSQVNVSLGLYGCDFKTHLLLLLPSLYSPLSAPLHPPSPHHDPAKVLSN